MNETVPNVVSSDKRIWSDVPGTGVYSNTGNGVGWVMTFGDVEGSEGRMKEWIADALNRQHEV